MHGSMEKRRDSRNRERESSADTRYSQSSTKKAVSKDVSFEDDLSSVCSDVSSILMPDLQAVHEEDEPSPRPRTSTVSGESGRGSACSRETNFISKADMASTAANLMKRTGRRKSTPGLKTDDVPSCIPGQTEPSQRVKAYCFDDEPISTKQTRVQPASLLPPPVILQGRIVPVPAVPGVVNLPKLDQGIPSGASTIPQSIKLTAPSLGNHSVSNVTSSSVQSNADINLLYPDFLRKRVVPEKHMVVPLEVDHSLLMEVDKERIGIDASNGDIGALLKLKTEKLDENEETWNKLTELSLFALSGFGFFETKLGAGTYNRGKKACILRQGQTEKDWMWENGLRIPISSRIAQGGASLNWSCLSESTAHEDAILLGDCTPYSLDAYESFVADNKKIEPHGKTPLTIDRFTRCAKQHIEIFCLLYGKEHKKERRDALEIMIELHESQPDLFTVSFLCQTWEAMTYAYLAEIKDGTRRMIRMLPDVVKKTDLRRKALSPGPSGRVLWEYPTTWFMTHPAGYWQASVKPKLEESV